MTVREKVIKGLECCIGDTRTDLPNLCTICPYARGSYATQNCSGQLRGDALALLKEQKPKIMTLNEVDALGDDAIVWLECLYTIDGKNTTILKPAIYQPKNSGPEEDGYYCVVSSWGQSGFYHKYSYMGEWRCWTSRPTDEQREAIPWLTT